ncbi:hypothetical protein [Pseudomonas pergaminensis]
MQTPGISFNIHTHLTALQPASVEVSAQHASNNTELSGERQLVASYAGAIRQAAQNHRATATLGDIPKDSRFGEWWQRLFNAAQSPVFLAWARSKNIDTSQAITVDHLADTLTVTINGKRTLLEGSEQGRGWREATGPLMTAAKAMGPFSFDVPTDPLVAPLFIVARFHGEVLLPYRKEETLARAAQLEQDQTFGLLDADTYVDVRSQSPEILQQQKLESGDSINRFTLLHKLKAFPQHQPERLTEYLNTRIPTHPDSSYQRETQNTDATLKDLIIAGGWHVPENVDELDNLIQALAAPSLLAPADRNFAGALAWPMPMLIGDQAELFRIISDNQPPLPGLDSEARLGSTDVLGALVNHVPRSVLEKGDPLATLQWILNSVQGQKLGEELKKRMGDVFEHSTPREVLLTVFAVTLDVEGLTDPKPNHVAGFDLAAPALHDQPFSVIKQRLVDHLVATNKVTPEAASVAAMLLLSRVAPELCVPDVPSDITYMSANWVRLKAAVGRIEATHPGASSRMSFQEIVDFDAIDPVTDHDQEVQSITAVPALVGWGRAKGVIPLHGDVSTEQLAEIRNEFAQQEQQILSGVSALTTPPPTLRAIALAQLKAHFGDGIPFEEKSIRSQVTRSDSHTHTSSITLDPTGSYSLLDLYLAKKGALPVGWASTNPKITEAIINKIATLPDPEAKHSEQFDEYATCLSQAWSTMTRKLISDLPLEDRKNIEWGNLTIYQRGHTSRTEVSTPQGGTEYSSPFSSSADDRSLIVETRRNGITTYYEFDPKNKTIRRRDDWQDKIREGAQGEEVESSVGIYGKKYTTEVIRKLDSTQDQANSQGREDSAARLPNSFSSDRSLYLGKLLSDTIIEPSSLAQIKASLGEETTFDEEENTRTLFRSFLLAPIPGGSAIYNLANGNYKDAAADAIFDVVMYATTAGFGKAGGAVKGLNRAKLPKRFGASLVAGKFWQGLSGGGRFARAGRKLFSNDRQWFGKLTGTSDSVNVAKLSNQPDIAVGTYRAGNSQQVSNIAAQFDEASGKWIPYDTLHNGRYGKPLGAEEFIPETARYIDDTAGVVDDVGEVVVRRKKPNHLESSLATNNAIHLGRKLKDFKVLGDGIFTYVDTYKGVERLNVCAHGVNPSFKQLLTNEPMQMFYNGKHNTPEDLLALLQSSGIDPERFNNVRLLMCHSANGSVNSFGSQFGKLIKRDVKAFQGPVRAYVIPDTVDSLKADLTIRDPHASANEIDQRIYRQLQFNLSLGTNKVGPRQPGGSATGKEIPFFYRPIKFKAS